MSNTEKCGCYECVGPEYGYDEHGRYLKNNLKRHTQFEPCDGCGRLKTEYQDLGTKGYYEGWWCNKRAVQPDTGPSGGGD